jgi:valyl-tRNA synthetase
METGWDILFFWVARMVLATTYATGQVPFKMVYLHGLVRTEEGKKMSKSHPETILNPMEVIPQYGTDALRFALIQGMSAGNDQRLGRSKIIANRNFANKLWNIARYVEGVVGDQSERKEVKPVAAADHWILDKLRQAQAKISQDLDKYRFSDAYDTLYHFVWNDVADWYIEASKVKPNKPLLAYLLENTLMIAHPFAPFVTETIWQTLAWENDSILATRTLQKILASNPKQAADFAAIQAIVTEVRSILKTLKVSGVTLYYTDVPFLHDNAAIIKRMAGLQAVSEVRDGSGLHLTNTRYTCWLDIDKNTAQAYLKGLEGKRTEQAATIERLEARLANKSYAKHAPKEIVEQTKDQLEEAQKSLESLEQEYKRFAD